MLTCPRNSLLLKSLSNSSTSKGSPSLRPSMGYTSLTVAADSSTLLYVNAAILILDMLSCPFKACRNSASTAVLALPGPSGYLLLLP